MKVQASYYQQFDADHRLDVPAEGYGGWKKAEIELAPAHTALVVMHAWETGTPALYPGWHRAVEFLQRANAILKTVFPPLLTAVRESGLTLYHVTSGSYYCKDYPGYRRAAELAGPTPELPNRATPDPVLERLRAFKEAHAFVGTHNLEDVGRGFKNMRFPPQAQPVGEEGIAENAHQLAALCKADGINHLIYTGFAINWCLLMSGGGMVDMTRRGFMCSAIRQAVTAAENKETARGELAKEIALWRLAVAFGFVFDLEEFLAALAAERDNG
jgi:nicotinamidase-related amidase